MLGALMAVLSSLCFGANSVFVRRGTPLARPRTGVLVTLILGPPMFLVVAAAFGELWRITEFTWLSILALAAAGAIHFVAGRTLNYTAVSLLGASRASVMGNSSLLISVAMAVTLLREPITVPIAVGATLMVLGPILISHRSAGRVPERPLEKRQFRLGLIAGLAAALCYGTSPLLIKFALRQASLPIAGSLVSYVAAFLVLGSTLFHRPVRDEMVHISWEGLLWYAAAGMAVNLAQLFRYVALSIAPVTLVAPLVQLSVLFTLILSVAINRRQEAVDRFATSGAFLTVAGAVILSL